MSDFDMVLVGNKMELIITDLVVLNKKEKAPPKYVVIDPAISEGGRLISGKRYLAYTREVPNRLGRVAVTDIKIINSGDRTPIGYRALSETMDDNVKSFSSKIIVVKVDPLETVKEAVTEVLVLSGSKKDQVPSGYKRLPEINGFSVCFHTQKLEANPLTNNSLGQQTTNKQNTQPVVPSSTIKHQVSTKPKSAVDDVTFTLSGSGGIEQYLEQFLLADLQILSFDEIDQKFQIDWETLEEQVQN